MPLRVLERKKLAPQVLVTESRGIVYLHTGQGRLGHRRRGGEFGPVVRARERNRGLVPLRHRGRPARREISGASVKEEHMVDVTEGGVGLCDGCGVRER